MTTPESESAPDTMIYAQLQVLGGTAELQLNGLPVMRLEPGSGRIPVENAAVEHLLVPGLNELRLLVEPGPRPSLAASPRVAKPYRAMSVTGRLMRVAADANTGPTDGQTLLDVAYRWSEDDASWRDFPENVVRTADLGPVHGKWAWQDAALLTPGHALSAEAVSFMTALDSAIMARDSGRMLELSALQDQDVLRAYPAWTPAQLRAEVEELLALYGGALIAWCRAIRSAMTSVWSAVVACCSLSTWTGARASNCGPRTAEPSCHCR